MALLAPLPINESAAFALCLYTLLGVIVGLAAAAFVRGLYFTEDLFEKIPGNYFRHMLGMAWVGAIIYGVHQAFGECITSRASATRPTRPSCSVS